MKIISLLLSAFFCISISNAQKKPFENQKSKRIEKIINSQWTFNYFSAETADNGYESPGYDDSKWPAISLPHSWDSYETTGELNPLKRDESDNVNQYWWSGWGWYRKHFSVNRDYSDRKVIVEFKGVQKYCKIWINGKYLGDNKTGDGSFNFDLTQFIKPGEDNLLAVSVNNSQKDKFNIPGITIENLDLNSGISGDVILILKEKLYIPEQGLSGNEGGTIVSTPIVNEKEGVVRVQTFVKNDDTRKRSCTLQTSIVDATNKIVLIIITDAVINPGQLYRFDQTGKPIKKPHLWSVNDQYSYDVYTEIIDGKEVVDTYLNADGLKFAIGDTDRILDEKSISEGLAEKVIKKTIGITADAAEISIAEEPAKIIISGSQQRMGADRGSVVGLTADIVDSKGNRVHNANNTIKWTVTGPATLVGPSVFESDNNKHHQTDGVYYLNMPVSNRIRSTGMQGKIKITVSATGLASGTFDILAEEMKADNSVIIEPILKDEGRKPVVRMILNVKRLDEVPLEIKMINDDFNLSPSDKPGFAVMIRDYILRDNRIPDTASIEFITIVDLFASHLFNNSGHLAAIDYNYTAGYYNNSRLISGYINSTKLPPLYKEGLKRYYANTIIRQGRERNAGEEMNWLNWIPSGGTVIVYQEVTTAGSLKGAVTSNKSNLSDLIAVVHPGFVKFSDEGKERALQFISKMNPYINVTAGTEQNIGGEKKMINVSYTAEKGKPILIPLLKFISE